MLVSPRKLGSKARASIERVESGRDEAWVPAAVVAEILLLKELGRIAVGLPQLHRAFRDAPGLRFLPLDLSQLEEFVALAKVRDPFDRLIVSAARHLRASLLTRDASLEESGLVETIWS
jgi:PIN domain nuclease of toxin-antitoxin system